MELQELALRKAILHSLKYMSNDVLGYLTKSNSSNSNSFEDAYPLSHMRITSPFISTSQELVKEQLDSNKKIGGIYESITNYQARGDDFVSPIARKLAQVVKSEESLDKVYIVTLNFQDMKKDDDQEPQENEIS